MNSVQSEPQEEFAALSLWMPMGQIQKAAAKKAHKSTLSC
jgi:hypothetical protein